MKILKLEIRCVRGITQLILEPNGENLVVYGPNGSGKSAVVDAIDFLLTGRVVRLTGAGTGGISLSKHGPHINFKPEDAVVIATIQLEGLSKPITIKRCMANPGAIECDQSKDKRVIAKLNQIFDIAKREQHVLTRREILKYITSEGATRAQQVQELLNISDVETIRSTLVRVNHTLERENNNYIRDVQTYEELINRMIGVNYFNSKLVIDFINEKRKILGGNPIVKLEHKEVKKGLNPPTKIEKQLINIELFENSVKTLKEFFLEKNVKTTTDYESSLRQRLQELRTDKTLLKALSRYQLIEAGIKLIDKEGSCPLCDKSWPPGKLLDYLKQKLLTGETARMRKQKIIAISNNLISSFSVAANLIRQIIDSTTAVKIDTSIIEHWLTDINDLIQILENPVDDYPNPKFSSESVSKLLAPKNIENVLTFITESVKKKIPKSSPNQTAWDILTEMEIHLKAFENARLSLKNSQSAYEKSTTLLKTFTSSRDRVLNELYDSISDSFAELYRELHGSDEENFKAILKPRGASLDFLVDFHGKGIHPPHALHSEGHQDSMGICLYLCMGNKLLGNDFELIILDDVVMSIDSEHRRQLCRLLLKHFPKKQFIITTHDKTWGLQLKVEGVVNRKRLIEFYDWEVDTGPKVNRETDIWQQVKENLRKNDIPSAAHRLRRGSEEFFAHVCNNLHANVRFKLDSRWDLGDLLPSAVVQYKKILKKAKESAQSWGEQNKLEALNEFESTLNQIFNRTQIEQWAINRNVHYSKWVDFSANDFKPISEAFEDLFLAFKCPQCKSLYYITESNNEPDILRCSCGKTIWNLKIKA